MKSWAAASLTLLNLWVQHAFYVINTKEPRKCALWAHRSNFLSSLVGCRHTQLHPSRPAVDDTKFTAKWGIMVFFNKTAARTFIKMQQTTLGQLSKWTEKLCHFEHGFLVLENLCSHKISAKTGFVQILCFRHLRQISVKRGAVTHNFVATKIEALFSVCLCSSQVASSSF